MQILQTIEHEGERLHRRQRHSQKLSGPSVSPSLSESYASAQFPPPGITRYQLAVLSSITFEIQLYNYLSDYIIYIGNISNMSE